MHARVATALGATLSVFGLLEWSSHESVIVHGFVVRWPYVHFAAMTSTATIQFGIPIALFPALMFARIRSGTLAPSTAFVTIGGGVLITLLATGWIGPEVTHQRYLVQRNAFISAVGPKRYMEPLRFVLDQSPWGKTWPELIRGAVTPALHQYPGYPRLVAEENQRKRNSHRAEAKWRLLLVLLGAATSTLGWTLGSRVGQLCDF